MQQLLVSPNPVKSLEPQIQFKVMLSLAHKIAKEEDVSLQMLLKEMCMCFYFYEWDDPVYGNHGSYFKKQCDGGKET